MANWRTFSDDHEIPGKILFELRDAVGADQILPFFEKHGMTNIDPNKWYPMQTMLNIYKDMSEAKSGTMFDFVSIGMQEATQAIVPPEFAAMPLLQILQGVGEVFKLNNRGTDFGSISIETLSDTHIKVTLRAVTPDDVWYGIFYGFVRRFAPQGTSFTVRYDQTLQPRRDMGGDVTVLDISWR